MSYLNPAIWYDFNLEFINVQENFYLHNNKKKKETNYKIITFQADLRSEVKGKVNLKAWRAF